MPVRRVAEWSRAWLAELVTRGGGPRIFISYDTRESQWAIFLKGAIERRVPGSHAFVARRDILPGEEPLQRMLEEELRCADAVVPICSPWSKASPWLWWEASAGWARRKKIFPLFLRLSAGDFGPPLTLVSQGRPFDHHGVEATLAEIVRYLTRSGQVQPLTTEEAGELAGFIAVAQRSRLDVDLEGRSCSQTDGTRTYRRVRVTNIGETTIANVEVKLDDFQPQGADFLPVRLQRMHEELEHPFTINPGDDVFVDVIARVNGSDQFFLCYDRKAYPSLPNQIEIRRYLLSLRITAEDTPPLFRHFTADVDGSGELVLRA